MKFKVQNEQFSREKDSFYVLLKSIVSAGIRPFDPWITRRTLYIIQGRRNVWGKPGMRRTSFESRKKKKRKMKRKKRRNWQKTSENEKEWTVIRKEWLRWQSHTNPQLYWRVNSRIDEQILEKKKRGYKKADKKKDESTQAAKGKKYVRGWKKPPGKNQHFYEETF